MRQGKKITKNKRINILITGDVNYNNINKFNLVMQQIYDIIQTTKVIATFGEKYGAQLLAKLYAEDKLTDYIQFDMHIFKNSKKPQTILYHSLPSIAVKWADIIIIFSNFYTQKINKIIKLCKKLQKEYIIVKE